MSRRLFLTRAWNRLSITSKFTLAFAVLLGLMVLTAATSFFALNAVRSQTEAAILTSTQIQQLVLEMDETVQHARRLERDFFLRWPTIGLTTARQDYAEAHQEQIAQVIGLNQKLQQLVDRPGVSPALQQSIPDLTTHASLVNLYADSFDQSVELVAELGRENSGVLARLSQHSTRLLSAIQATQNADLLATLRTMQAYETEYRLTRERPHMQLALNQASALRQAVENQPTLPPQTEILTHLEAYEATIQELLTLDNQIKTLRNGFDRQATAVDPLSERLITLANTEVEQARQQINQTSQLATAVLVVTTVAAVLLAIIIALLLNQSVTRNVVNLTQAAVQLQQGNLQIRSNIDSQDELGQLSDTFNILATRITTLVDELEAEAKEAHTRLREAIENISEGFALYDSQDRLMLYNSKYREMYGHLADISVGTYFENIIRAAAEQGFYLDAVEPVEAWIAQRLDQHRNPQGALELQLASGRWIQINEYKTEEEGIFGIHTDITARKAGEAALRRQNAYLEALHETTLGLLGHLDLNELLEDIISRAGQLLGTQHGYIYLAVADGTKIERQVGVGSYAGQSPGFRLGPHEGIAGRVWQTGQPLVVNDCQSWPGRSSNVDYSNIHSLAGVPLKSGPKVIGVIGMAYDIETGEQFETDEVELLSRFAQLASLALEHARLYTAAQEEKKRSDNLLNVVIPLGVELSAEQNFDRLLEKILLETKAFCNADAGTLYLRTENDQLEFVIVRNDSLQIEMGGTSGQPPDFPPVPMFQESGQPNHSNVAAHVALTGQTINIPDAYQAAGFNFSGTQKFDRQFGYRSTSFLTIPLKNARNYVMGVLQLINARAPGTGQTMPFSPFLEQTATSLSSLATVALEAYIREQTLRQQIQQLKIEIDEVKRQQQVTEIVETDFFQELQTKARNIRRRSQDPSGESK